MLVGNDWVDTSVNSDDNSTKIGTKETVEGEGDSEETVEDSSSLKDEGSIVL